MQKSLAALDSWDLKEKKNPPNNCITSLYSDFDVGFTAFSETHAAVFFPHQLTFIGKDKKRTDGAEGDIPFGAGAFYSKVFAKRI